MRLLCVVGARPNFMKIAPIMRAFAPHRDVQARLLHTGQHYDAAMSGRFFDDLGLSSPDIALTIGSGSNDEQIARTIDAMHPVLRAENPDAVLVVGDVNASLAAAVAAAERAIPVVHVEAGLRSHDLAMPEERNRIEIDRRSTLLLTTEAVAAANLSREGIDARRICFVGNVMIDTLRACLPRAIPVFDTLVATDARERFRKRATKGYGLVTLHRPSNVDDPDRLHGLLQSLVSISLDMPLVFAMHPRTRAAIEAAGLEAMLDASDLHATPPLGYLATLGLMRDAKVVVTDSGGMQEETTVLGVPCLTMRDSTERPVTIEVGTNTLVGTSPAALAPAIDDVLRTGGKRGRMPDLWDGHAAERIVAAVLATLRTVSA